MDGAGVEQVRWADRLQLCDAARCGHECAGRVRRTRTFAPLAGSAGMAIPGASSGGLCSSVRSAEVVTDQASRTRHAEVGRRRITHHASHVMSVLKPITIVGGGLAGLSLGIGLRRRGIPVTVWEAGHYPRHRVCGEFISGGGQDSLKRLGIWDSIVQAGGTMARTAVFFSTKIHSPVRPLPQPALSISRLVLGALLAESFESLGGDLRQHERWAGKDFGAGIVRASGRRSKPIENGWRWFGLKIHAQNVPLSADLEMHVLPN